MNKNEKKLLTNSINSQQNDRMLNPKIGIEIQFFFFFFCYKINKNILDIKGANMRRCLARNEYQLY